MTITLAKTTIIAATFLTTFALALCACSSPAADEKITNTSGHYSIIKLADWNVEMKNRSAMISKERRYDSAVITASLRVAPGNSDAGLDETFAAVKNSMPNTVEGYQYINDGYTQIGRRPAQWIKFSRTLYGFKYVSVQYYMEIAKGNPVMLECTSVDGTFEDFEEDFNKMVFSFRIEN